MANNDINKISYKLKNRDKLITKQNFSMKKVSCDDIQNILDEYKK